MTSTSNDDVIVSVVDDVIRLKWTEGITITEDAARLAASFVNVVSADRRRPMIVDMTRTAAVTRQARTVFLEPGAASRIALLGRSPVDRVIAELHPRGSATCPVRPGSSPPTSAALTWLTEAAPA